MKKFLIKTLGCKVNSYESEFIRSLFLCNGYEETKSNADVCVINTCTVTNTSDNKSKKTINNIRNDNPNAIVVSIGCFCQFRKDTIENIIDSDIILGNKNKSKILEYIKQYEINHKKIVDILDMESSTFEDMEIKHFYTHHRAFIKIEDGCNNFCSYCIIPYVRGRVRSKDFDKCIKEVKSLVSSGHKEIVLTGIHTGQYKSNNKRLCDLIEEMSKINGLKRIRLSSVEIVELDEGMMNVLQNNKVFVSHLHIPLQSGSDTILKSMNRRYDKKYFLDKVNTIRNIRKDISLTTDVIVGFPGETDELFKESFDFCNQIHFSKIHVFPYSDRFGTVASKMPEKVDNSIKKERVHKLLDLSNKMEKEYYESHIDREVSVLIEEYKDGYYYGYTDNYIYLKLKGNYKVNDIYNIIIKKEDILTK